MPDIIYETRDNIAYITIDRPQAMNALGPAQQQEIIQVWQDFRDDPEALVAIVTGQGDRAFCAGADLKTYTPLLGERSSYEVRQDANRVGFGGITRGLEIWKPIIAAVNGYALAGGLELALACDIRIASDNAQFGCSEVRRGFHHCDGGTVRLPLIVGLGNALKLQLTGEPIDAAEALRIGLVHQVTPPGELVNRAEQVASTIAALAPVAARYAKEAVFKGMDMTLDHGILLETDLTMVLQTTKDRDEGIRSFLERRDPEFRGE